MKIPITWLKDYVATDQTPTEIAASFTQLGLMLDKPVDNSGVLDLEHRMDRADWLSIVGCARDYAAFENLKLKEPALYTKVGHRPSTIDHISIKVETPHVRRFNTRVFRGVKVGPSPAWLADRLSAYGIPPINNIVDITNFVMVEYGQTMHAQDLAKMKGLDITIRQAQAGEKLVTLLGTEAQLDSDTFVLTSGGVVTVIGGIVGGIGTGVTNTTTDIILDAGNYDSRVIRQNSRRLKILNESVSRNDKFLDPRLIDVALARATRLILEISGGTYYDNVDYYPHPVSPQTKTLHFARLKLLSGLDLPTSTVKRILQSLGYTIVEDRVDALTVEIPYFRTDVEVEDDLVADILRIYNYRNLPSLPLNTAVPADITPAIYLFEDRLRDLLVSQEAHEHITTPLVQSTQLPTQITLANALSSDQNALRTSLVPNLERVLINYGKHGQSDATIFEIGKTFHRDLAFPHERRDLTVCGTSDMRPSLATLLHSLGIAHYSIAKDLTITVNQKICGSITVRSFTLYTDSILPPVQPYSPLISTFSHPKTLDISLVVPTKIQYADILEALGSLKFHWDTLACIAQTKLSDKTNNYLLQITWPEKSQAIESDKALLHSTLTTKLGITSKS